MQIDNSPIDIVLPHGIDEASISSLRLCELFISGLLSSDLDVINVAVDRTAKSVTCQDQRIRETIRLILGAGKLDVFVDQLTSLFHASLNEGALGDLICNTHGLVIKFIFYKEGVAAIDWRIVSEQGASQNEI